MLVYMNKEEGRKRGMEECLMLISKREGVIMIVNDVDMYSVKGGLQKMF